jgi:hypothetical protein
MQLNDVEKVLIEVLKEERVRQNMARIMLSGKPETRVRDLVHCRLFDNPDTRPFSEWSGRVGNQKVKRVDLAVCSHSKGIPKPPHGLVEFKAWMGIDVYDDNRWTLNPAPEKLGHSIIGQFDKDAASLRHARNGAAPPWLAICTLLYSVRPQRHELREHLKYPVVIRRDLERGASLEEMCEEYRKRMMEFGRKGAPDRQVGEHVVLFKDEKVCEHFVSLAAVWSEL